MVSNRIVVVHYRMHLEARGLSAATTHTTQGTFMEHFLLEHPPDRLIRCDRSECKEIADYLELHEGGREDLVCATHTSSQRHASVLPSRPSAARVGSEQRPCQAVLNDLPRMVA